MRQAALLSLIILTFPIFSYAQVDQGGVNDVISAGIDLIITPETPGPNTTARATLESSSLDLDTSNISWKLNGSTVTTGRGLKEITFATGASGTKTSVSATITASVGIFTKSITLENGSVDLIWQGRTYAPPFYKGRALWTYQSGITFFAIPHVSGNPANLIYRWSEDGEVLGTVSGVGKNSLSISDSILGLTHDIKVEILTDGSTVAAESSIDISPGEPLLLVYENNPIYGLLLNKEVGQNYALTDKEITFAGFPYFYSVTERNSNKLDYEWSTNSGNNKSGEQITFRSPDTPGQASIDLSLKNLTNILQTGEKSFLVQFHNENTL